MPPSRESGPEASGVSSSISLVEVTEVGKVFSCKAPGVDEIRLEMLNALDIGITLLSLPGKVYAKVLERRLRPIVEPQIEEEQYGFRLGHGTMDQLFTLLWIVEGAWEFANTVYMCFMDLEKAYDCVPRDILQEVLLEYDAPGCLLVGVYQARPTEIRPQGHSRTHSRDYISKLAWERLGVPGNELEDVAEDRVIWDSLLSQLLP
ncbi:hypothetical protein AOLI_G00113700 [Acnodon oligacanthus]